MSKQSRSPSVESDGDPGQRTYAVQTFAVVALAGLIVGVPSLFDANGSVVFLVLVTAVLVTGGGLLVSPRTRSWGRVVAAAACVSGIVLIPLGA
ncbi:hypothetical protein [Gordonia rubripertincta]|uniref:hypothetical protein n=1 Tax=Gordonia rubripertincta TaxID=36822 RepID=UPI0015F9B614|nr:hypothetical protein [Gordonia rubripertincta]QMU21135.1 hypothetical protein H3V45_00990 [Gordonia rubripertincta]